MKKETIIERFDEKIQNHSWNCKKDFEGCSCYLLDIKNFLFDTIKEVILELGGEREPLTDVQEKARIVYSPMTGKIEKLSMNKKRQEFLDKAREEGLI